MPIDLVGENVIPLREAADVLPRRCGKKVNFTTLWRWSCRGVRGVKLETLRIGGTLYTSTEALQRFAEAATTGRPMTVSALKRREQIIDAAERLAIETGY